MLQVGQKVKVDVSFFLLFCLGPLEKLVAEVQKDSSDFPGLRIVVLMLFAAIIMNGRKKFDLKIFRKTIVLSLCLYFFFEVDAKSSVHYDFFEAKMLYYFVNGIKIVRS